MLGILWFFAVVSSVISLEADVPINGIWKKFKNTYGKNYSSEEENTRKSIFKENMESILKQNVLADLGGESFKLGVNEFVDMTEDEFFQKMSGFVPGEEPGKINLVASSNEDVSEIPDSMDWRDSGFVTPVKNQGGCASCWAFATAAVLETHYGLATNKLVDLSEQHLLDCVNNYGCGVGGSMFWAYHYIMDNGISEDGCYPYKAYRGRCQSDKSCNGASMATYKNLTNGNEMEMLQAVAKKGPVLTTVYSRRSDFRFYKSGIYKVPNCGDRTTHAVVVIGYGSENGQDYWLVKNSYGRTWGMDGYFKIARNAGNMCGIAMFMSYPIV